MMQPEKSILIIRPNEVIEAEHTDLNEKCYLIGVFTFLSLFGTTVILLLCYISQKI